MSESEFPLRCKYGACCSRPDFMAKEFVGEYFCILHAVLYCVGRILEKLEKIEPMRK